MAPRRSVRKGHSCKAGADNAHVAHGSGGSYEAVVVVVVVVVVLVY